MTSKPKRTTAVVVCAGLLFVLSLPGLASAEKDGVSRSRPLPMANIRRFEAQGRVDSILLVDRRVTINGRSYPLAKGFTVIDAIENRLLERKELASIRGRQVGYIVRDTPDGEVVTSILVFPKR